MEANCDVTSTDATSPSPTPRNDVVADVIARADSSVTISAETLWRLHVVTVLTVGGVGALLLIGFIVCLYYTRGNRERTALDDDGVLKLDAAASASAAADSAPTDPESERLAGRRQLYSWRDGVTRGFLRPILMNVFSKRARRRRSADAADGEPTEMTARGGKRWPGDIPSVVVSPVATPDGDDAMETGDVSYEDERSFGTNCLLRTDL